MFGYPKNMNLSLQGRGETICDVKDKLPGLNPQMGVWQAQIKVGSTTSFPLSEKHAKMNRIDLPDNIKICIIEHLEIVSAEFHHTASTALCTLYGFSDLIF